MRTFECVVDKQEAIDFLYLHKEHLASFIYKEGKLHFTSKAKINEIIKHCKSWPNMLHTLKDLPGRRIYLWYLRYGNKVEQKIK